MAPTIVVGVDGSPDSAFALDWATAEARLSAARIRVVFGLHMPVVVMPFAPATFLPPSPELSAYAEEVLTAAAQRIRAADPEIAVDTSLVLRPPVQALLSAAKDAAMLVVGTRGLGTLGALTLGSVSSRVAAQATCPVVVVPPAELAGAGPVGDAGAIVVGLDGSAHSNAALRFALDLAATRSATIVAVHAYLVPLPDPTLVGPDFVVRSETIARTHAESVLDHAVQDAVDATSSTARVIQRAIAGNPVDALIDTAPEATLTVIGSRGRGGVRAMLLGSVSQSVLHRADHPVVIVRADDVA